jgi:hypothetical protein
MPAEEFPSSWIDNSGGREKNPKTASRVPELYGSIVLGDEKLKNGGENRLS